MSRIALPPVGEWTAYWHQRVRAETRAALACDDPRIAALHVELATRCLRMAGCERLDALDKSQPRYAGSDQPRAIATPRSAKPASTEASAANGPLKPSSEKATNRPDERAAAVT